MACLFDFVLGAKNHHSRLPDNVHVMSGVSLKARPPQNDTNLYRKVWKQGTPQLRLWVRRKILIIVLLCVETDAAGV